MSRRSHPAVLALGHPDPLVSVLAVPGMASVCFAVIAAASAPLAESVSFMHVVQAARLTTIRTYCEMAKGGLTAM